MSDKTSNVKAEASTVRKALVDTAINFLLNPTVTDKPYAHKTAFLKKKGLTDAEIAVAYDKVENDPKYKEQQRSGVSVRPLYPPPVPYGTPPLPFWTRLSTASSSLIVLGVALYGVHYFYKNYIEPLIFGTDSESVKSEKMETHLVDVSKSILQIDKNIAALEEKINSQKTQMDKFLENEVNEYCPTPLALRELKVEIAAVKSLLLNRHQFPALPKVSAPTIPEWQLAAKEDTSISSQQNGEENDHDTDTDEIQATADDSHSNIQNGVTEDSEAKFMLDQNELSEKINDLPAS